MKVKYCGIVWDIDYEIDYNEVTLTGIYYKGEVDLNDFLSNKFREQLREEVINRLRMEANYSDTRDT